VENIGILYSTCGLGVRGGGGEGGEYRDFIFNMWFRGYIKCILY